MGNQYYHLIKCIGLSEGYSYINEKNESQTTIDNLSKVNLFIGQNNSGKSRLIRDMCHTNKLLNLNFSADYLKNLNKKFIDEVKEYTTKNRLPYADFDKKIDLMKLGDMNKPSVTIQSIKYIFKLKDKIIESFKEDNRRYTDYSQIPFKQIREQLLQIYENTYKELLEINKNDSVDEEPFYKKIYIPILRGLRPIGNTTDYNDIYAERIREVYFKNITDTFEIFTGLNVFEAIQSYYNGETRERDLLKDYAEYLSRNFFNGKPIALVPNSKTRYLTIKIGNEAERPIYELGDGLQTIIIITFPLFINRDKRVILFVDEPEQYLHPGFQRKLLDTLLNQDGFEKFQYFLTTHSNHFLDMMLDYENVSVYSIKKNIGNGKDVNADFTIKNVSFGDRTILESLGVRNSSVFLSNCTIWVEGITDRFYFKTYLELYQEFLNKGKEEPKYYIEDNHYSFVEYSGNNITHWSFLDKNDDTINVETLCGKLFLIADYDSDKKLKRHSQLEAKLKERYCKLSRKEVENLLLPHVIKGILKEYKETDDPELKYKSYTKRSLGTYIDDNLPNRKREHSYADGNTVYDKVNFCNKAKKYIKDWEKDVSDDAKDVTKQIYEFIQSNN